MSTLKEDISRVEGKVDGLNSKLNAFLVAHAKQQAELTAKVDRNAGTIKTILVITSAVISGLAYAAWDLIKHKLGLK